jgi:hypothetical protein
MYPYVLSAKQGFDARLGRMHAYYEKARSIAALLTTFPQLEVVPNPPRTNMMHLFLRGDRNKLQSAALDVARETKTWLFGGLGSTILPSYSKFELTVGDATLDLSIDEISMLFELLFRKAEA